LLQANARDITSNTLRSVTPSRRGYTNEKNASEIADAIAALGFNGIK
jgi:hypothetical protein